jgi:hypothetical protein
MHENSLHPLPYTRRPKRRATGHTSSRSLCEMPLLCVLGVVESECVYSARPAAAAVECGDESHVDRRGACLVPAALSFRPANA